MSAPKKSVDCLSSRLPIWMPAYPHVRCRAHIRDPEIISGDCVANEHTQNLVAWMKNVEFA